MGQVFLMGGSGGIDVEGADATTEQVLNGAKFYSNENKGDEILVGSMPNNGKIEQTLNAGGTYTIPTGYHNGEGYVKATDLALQTTGTATASAILKGKTAWVDGSQITGTIPSQSGENITITTTAKTYSAGYYPSGWTVSAPTQRSAPDKPLNPGEYVDYYAGYYPSNWRVSANGIRGARGLCSRNTDKLNLGDTVVTFSWNNIGFKPNYLCIVVGKIDSSASSGNYVSAVYWNGTSLSYTNIGQDDKIPSFRSVSATGCTIKFTIPVGWDAGTISGQSYFIAAS